MPNKNDAVNPITFIGSLPPPFTGRTVMTQVVVDALEKNGPLRRDDWSFEGALIGLKLKLVRFRKAIASILRILLGQKKAEEVLYFPVNAGWGQLYDIALVVAARLRGYRTVLHHHSYSYINNHDWRTALTNRLLGKSDAHVVHCELMKQDFLAKYATRAKFMTVPPTIVSQEHHAVPRSTHDTFTLGFMSNLTIAKGLGHVLDTFEHLIEAGQDVALVLAGPCKSRVERTLIDRAVAKWPERVDYRDAVYDDRKKQFFADIDVFLFPTEYVNESWGIVLTEALATKCPVIAFSRGCIPWIVQDGCGLVVEPDENFVEHASKQIMLWIENQDEHQRVCQLASDRTEALSQESKRLFRDFLEEIRRIQ